MPLRGLSLGDRDSELLAAYSPDSESDSERSDTKPRTSRTPGRTLSDWPGGNLTELELRLRVMLHWQVWLILGCPAPGPAGPGQAVALTGRLAASRIPAMIIGLGL